MITSSASLWYCFAVYGRDLGSLRCVSDCLALCASMSILYIAIGSKAFALVALLLLMLPDELIFQVLHALPRFVDLRRTF